MNEMPPLEKQKSQSGQAIVEYVLLLAIVVALILGLGNQFYKPFGNWVQNQMGPYLECLLDVGELPSLGGDKSGECANEFEAFASGSASGGGSRSGKGESPGDNDPANKKAKKPADSADSGSSYTGNSRGSNGTPKGFPISGRHGSDGGKSGAGNETMVEKLPDSKFFKLKSVNVGSFPIPQKVAATGVTGLLPAERQKIEKREETSFKAGSLDEETSQGGRAKKLVVKPSERKMATEEEDKPWSFAEYIKYAVILMIIIAIILFLAGQAAQISKSMDK